MTSLSIKPTTFLNTSTSSQNEDQEAQEISIKAEDQTIGKMIEDQITTDHPEEMTIDAPEISTTDHQEETKVRTDQDKLKVNTDQPETSMIDHQEEIKAKIDQEEPKAKIDQEEPKAKIDHKELKDPPEITKETPDKTIETIDHQEEITTGPTIETLIEEEKTPIITDHSEDNNKDTSPEEKSSEKELPCNGPRSRTSVQEMTDLTLSSR